MIMKALLNIDYTYDFVAEDGKLTAGKPAQDIHDSIVKITKDFIDNGDYTIFAIDIHEENDPYHPETKLFPPHNIIGTSGRDLYGQLEDLYQENKDNPNVYYTDKTRYSAFQGTDVELRLRTRGIKEVHLVGVYRYLYLAQRLMLTTKALISSSTKMLYKALTQKDIRQL